MSKILIELIKKNPDIKYSLIENKYRIENIWNDESIAFEFKKNQKISFFKDLIFPEQLYGFYNSTFNKIEFIYGLIQKNSKLLDRNFEFIYKNICFKCFYSSISNELKSIATNFVENNVESPTDYRNLRLIRDVLTKEIFIKAFKDYKIVSFFIEGEFDKIDFDFVGLSKSLNFYMTYFDRDSPKIIIYEKINSREKYDNGCFFSLFDAFPKRINSVNIDATLLDTFMVANLTDNIRLKFIFYFQILEYSSYYYLDSKIQNRITQTFRNPEIYDKPEEFSKVIIEEMKDHFSQKDDSIKLEKTITENVFIEDIKNEIEANKDFFASDLEFEGGLKINRILKDSSISLDNLKSDDMILIKKNIEKIRNVLVHLRESRENKVILPSKSNDQKLLPYLYLLRRIAEKVAINFR
ncbi:hypothetical protein KB553_02000 [Chryseobacterium rhizoplanae]|uniref:hypothetical protein n=1 Tax=Chryseobacterium rhizoplanae TaxID=1609531 RepID=UPI001CE2E759|nr:hypothetical protein [Chryseobacterium rhizoplanae]UCA60311.1 hypothetical protein KB553_02000 [Chryseobacterium rhizoplanae]